MLLPWEVFLCILFVSPRQNRQVTFYCFVCWRCHGFNTGTSFCLLGCISVSMCWAPDRKAPKQSSAGLILKIDLSEGGCRVLLYCPHNLNENFTIVWPTAFWEQQAHISQLQDSVSWGKDLCTCVLPVAGGSKCTPLPMETGASKVFRIRSILMWSTSIYHVAFICAANCSWSIDRC